MLQYVQSAMEKKCLNAQNVKKVLFYKKLLVNPNVINNGQIKEMEFANNV